MKIKLYRFDPDKDQQGYFSEYEVPVREGTAWTVMDVLDYIALNYDSSLSYFRHSACNHGICCRCVMKINGKPDLACTYVVKSGDGLMIEPSRADKLVKDLVIR